MITLEFNSKNLNEKKYIANFIFQEILDEPYKIKVSDLTHRINIILPNNYKISINSDFFNLDKIISKENIPSSCETLKSDFLTNSELPVFYGLPQILVEPKETKIEFDLFGMIFFMLTRWEESLSNSKDNHDRFPASESLAYKHNFLHRPIVNELIEIIINICKSQGLQLIQHNHYQVFLTHDIDHFYYPTSPKKFIGDIIKRKSFSTFLKRLAYKKNSPYNTFEWLITQSNKRNIKSHFYFMGSNPNPLDNNYMLNDKNILNAVNLIKKSKHIIGIHPSYHSLKNPSIIHDEKERIEHAFSVKITEGRQHYLRFDNNQTWKDWDDNDLKVDSTLGYPEAFGFRCGTGNQYSTYDLVNRKTLKLKERPLLYMDSTGRYYQNLSTEQIYTEIEKLNKACKKHNTPITLNFHNSSFDDIEWPHYKNLYLKILDHLISN